MVTFCAVIYNENKLSAECIYRSIYAASTMNIVSCSTNLINLFCKFILYLWIEHSALMMIGQEKNISVAWMKKGDPKNTRKVNRSRREIRQSDHASQTINSVLFFLLLFNLCVCVCVSRLALVTFICSNWKKIQIQIVDFFKFFSNHSRVKCMQQSKSNEIPTE